MAMTAALAAASAPAAQVPVANLSVNVVVGTDTQHSSIILRGDTIAVRKLEFAVGVQVENQGPDESTSARVRLVLPSGLHWGADAPDPSENCTHTDTVADCRTPGPMDATAGSTRAAGWAWDVVAAAQGRYVLRGELVESTPPDPDPTDDTSTVTVVVKTAAGPVVASPVRIKPAIPKAGAPFSASVRVTMDGAPVNTHTPACAAAFGNFSYSWTARAIRGLVTCVYRTPKAAKGKTLRGSVTFAAQGRKFVRRFAVILH
jgi:hypothetical protein